MISAPPLNSLQVFANESMMPGSSHDHRAHVAQRLHDRIVAGHPEVVVDVHLPAITNGVEKRG